MQSADIEFTVRAVVATAFALLFLVLAIGTWAHIVLGLLGIV